MKKKSYIVLVISIVFFIIAISFFVYVIKIKKDNTEINDLSNKTTNNQINNAIDLDINDNMAATIEAVILEVHSSTLTVMDISDNNGLTSVSMGEQGNIGYKKGQEIIIYFDGIIITTYPGQILNVGKIEITKEQTNITIPDKYLEYYNKPTNRVKVSLLELEKTGISFLVYSENELLSDYSEDYEIFRSGSYGGEGINYIEKLEKNSDIPIEDTIMLTTDLERENDTNFIIKYDIDWRAIYGELNTIDER